MYRRNILGSRMDITTSIIHSDSIIACCVYILSAKSHHYRYLKVYIIRITVQILATWGEYKSKSFACNQRTPFCSSARDTSYRPLWVNLPNLHGSFQLQIPSVFKKTHKPPAEICSHILPRTQNTIRRTIVSTYIAVSSCYGSVDASGVWNGSQDVLFAAFLLLLSMPQLVYFLVSLQALEWAGVRVWRSCHIE